MFTVRNTRSKRHRQGLQTKCKHQTPERQMCTQKLLLIIFERTWNDDVIDKTGTSIMAQTLCIMLVINIYPFIDRQWLCPTSVDFTSLTSSSPCPHKCWLGGWLFYKHGFEVTLFPASCALITLTVTHSTNFPGILLYILVVNAILWNTISRAKIGKGATKKKLKKKN